MFTYITFPIYKTRLNSDTEQLLHMKCIWLPKSLNITLFKARMFPQFNNYIYMLSICNDHRSLATPRIYLCIGFSTKKLFHQKTKTFITYDAISYSLFLSEESACRYIRKFCRLVCMDEFYKRSKFRLNRTTNKGVIKGQNIGYSSPTLDCLFEPNATFTDRTEIGARWKAWGNGSLGPLAQKFWKPRFRVLAIESWYLPMFDP